MKAKVFFVLIFNILLNLLFAEVAFSGFAGAKLDLDSNKESSNFDGELKIQSFFSGQLNLARNCILRGEFSLQTNDIIDNSVFKETPATFKIDELSLLFRHQGGGITNYLNIFVGDYEPIGSDIFLRRQFGMQPIASKATQNWLGLSGSVIYPLFGVGASDILHFDSQPIATGIYIYVNHELDDSYVLNAAYRFACAYRFLTLDLVAGVGFPLQASEYDDALAVVDRIYFRGGINLLVGNAYTTSLFIQGGISDIPFSNNVDFEFDETKTYLLFEPRFHGRKCKLDITAFSLPEDTVKNFVLLDDTLGFNINIYADNLYAKSKTFLFGVNGTLSFSNKTYMDLDKIADFFDDDYSINVAPYFETKLYNGDLRLMLQLDIADFINDDWYKGIKISLGYKSQF